MDSIVNGMSAAEISGAVWRKSIRSGAQGGNCVEVAELPGEKVALRNSRHPDGPALVFTHSEMTAFVAGAKAGEFDVPAPGGAQPDQAGAAGEHTPDGHHAGVPERYQRLGNEVHQLTEQLICGETVLTRETSEKLLRILSGVALLHRMHRVDRDGNCAICRTKSRRWHPSSRHDACSVYAAMSLYLGRSLMASEEAQPYKMDESTWPQVRSAQPAR